MNIKLETNKDADIIRGQIIFIKAGESAGFPITEKQKEWLSIAEKEMFWFNVQFENAEKILGRKPINQDEAMETVRNYNKSQNALSR